MIIQLEIDETQERFNDEDKDESPRDQALGWVLSALEHFEIPANVAVRPEPTERHALIRDMASDLYAKDGVLEIDDEALVSESNDNGAYVQAWVWVGFVETDLDKTGPEDEKYVKAMAGWESWQATDPSRECGEAAK